MKLSEMNTEQLADAMVKMVEPAREIATDEVLIHRLKELAGEQREKTRLENMADTAFLIIPLLLERHRSAAYAILSAMTGKTVKQLAAQNGLQTIREARECVDQDLLDFFR